MEDQQANWSYSSETEQPDVSVSGELISWSASEYIQHEKSPLWYVAVAATSIFVSVIAYFVNDKDLLVAITLLVVSFSVVFFASRKPASKNYELGNGKLKIGEKIFDLRNFKSFSLVEEGAINSIWLKPLGRVSPMIIIYFAPEDENKIATALGMHLPYEFRELDPLDRLVRRLRF